MYKRLLLIAFSIIILGFLIGYAVDNYKVYRLKRQNEELLEQFEAYSKRLDSLSGAIDSLQNSNDLIFNDMNKQDSSRIIYKTK